MEGVGQRIWYRLQLPLKGNQSLTFRANPTGTGCQGHREHPRAATVKTSIEAHGYFHFTRSLCACWWDSVLPG